VSTESSATLSGGLVDNNVGDEKLLSVQALDLSVALSVLQQVNNEVGRLNGPTGLCGLERLGLSSAANTTVVAAEGNGLLVLLDVTEVRESLAQLHASDSSSYFTSVLEMNTEIRTSGLGRLGSIGRGSSVSNHV